MSGVHKVIFAQAMFLGSTSWEMGPATRIHTWGNERMLAVANYGGSATWADLGVHNLADNFACKTNHSLIELTIGLFLGFGSLSSYWYWKNCLKVCFVPKISTQSLEDIQSVMFPVSWGWINRDALEGHQPRHCSSWSHRNPALVLFQPVTTNMNPYNVYCHEIIILKHQCLPCFRHHQ